MALDRYYSGWRPEKAHLVRGKGGLSGEINDLRDDIEGALRKVAEEADAAASGSSSLASEISSTAQELQDAIADASDAANAATASAVADLSAQIAEDLARAEDVAASYADVAAELLNERISQVAADANSAMVAAVDDLANEVAADIATAALDATAIVDATTETLRAEIAQSANDVSAAVAADVFLLNERINKLHPVVQTNDGVLTDLVTIPVPFNRSVLLEVRVLAQRIPDRLERALYTIEALCRAVPSLGTLTVSGIPTVGDQVEIGGVTYTFQDVLAAAFDVKRDAGTAEANIDNLVAAIMLSGTPGVEYHASTTLHPTVFARKDTAATMEAVAKTPGVAGDAITTTDPVDTGGVLNWGGATLAGGSDMTVSKVLDRNDVEDEPAWDADVVAGTGYAVKVQGQGEAGKDVDWLVVSRYTEM